MKTDKLFEPNEPMHAGTLIWVDRLVYGLMRHWLAIVLTAMLIFVGLPFLAPIAMEVGWQQIGLSLYALYSLFCHQLPQRSWFLFGEQLTYTLAEISAVVSPIQDPLQLRTFLGTPTLGWKVAWSDRMISFYFMVPVSGLVYALLRAQKRLVRPLSFRLLLLLLLPLALDGGTHALSDLLYGVSGGGFRDTNGWLAWLTQAAFPGFYAGDNYGTFNWWARLITGLIAAGGVAFWFFPLVDRIMIEEVQRHHSRLKPGFNRDRQFFHSRN